MTRLLPRPEFLQIVFLAGCLALAGCPQSDDPSGGEELPMPFGGVHLRLMVPTELNLTDSWEPAVNDWARDCEGDVEIVEVDFQGAPSKWLSRMQEAPTSLVLLPTAQVGELVGAGLAATIPADLIEAGVIAWHPIPPSVRSTLDMLRDAPAFVTVTCPTPVVAVRADLLEAAGRSLPATWEEYDRLVAEVADWAPGLVAVEPRDEANLPTLFLARAVSGARHPAQLSVELDVSNGDPLIASAPYVRALTEMQALTPHLASDVRSMTPADCLRSLTEGKAALGTLWEHVDPSAAPTATARAEVATTFAGKRGNIVFLPMPGRTEVYDRDLSKWTPSEGDGNRPALCGFAGWSVAVTKVGSATDQAAAWDLWGLLASYQSERMIPPLPGSSTTPALTPSIVMTPGLSPEEQRQFNDVQSANLLNPSLVCELPMMGRNQLREVLGAAIATSLDDGTPAAAALQEAASKWSALIDKLGRLDVLNSDRVRLGLVPIAE